MHSASARTDQAVPATTAAQALPTKHWSLVKSSGICPTARSGHSAVVAKESLYIFGGCGHPAVKRGSELAGSEAVSSAEDEDLAEAMPVCLGDLNVYDLARQRWSKVVFPPAGAGAKAVLPAERTCAAMCASEEEDRLFLSGGAGDDPYDLRADLLEFDVRRRSWRLLYDGGAGDDVGRGGSEGSGAAAAAAAAAAAGASACRRIGHAMVHDAERNRLVVFGGSTGHEYFDDTHAFDLATGTWAALATTGDRPSPRYKHQVFVDASVMYVIGGGSYEPEGPDLDAYRLHFAGPKALEWERVRPTGAPPCCRAAHGLAWDRVGRQAYIWGGFTSDMELDSTFCALRLPPPAPAAVSPGPDVAAAAAGEDDGGGDAARPVCSAVMVAVEGASIPGSADHHHPAAAQRERTAVNDPATASISSSMTASATASATACAAAAITIESRGLAGFVEADTSGVNGTRRVSAAGVTRNKPAGGEARSSAAGTELAEQQQQQQQQQQRDPQQRNPQQRRDSQRDPQQQRDHQQQQQPPVSRAEDSRPSRGRHGRERWRRRGHRLLRQQSGELDNGGNSGGSSGNSGNSGNSAGNASGARRSRGSGGRRRRTWGQGWTTGRLQGLWGGGGGGGGARPDDPPSPSGPPLPLPPPPRAAPPAPDLGPIPPRQANVAVVAASASGTHGGGGGGGAASSSINRAVRAVGPSAIPPPHVPPQPEQQQGHRSTPTASKIAAGEDLSWVSLPNHGQPSREGGGDGAGGGRSSPAGRSFHCAFFHEGACYVTGGSDGARKFGDMWRFCARESPPSLTTLAARVLASSAPASKGGGGGGGGGGGRGDGGGDGGGGSGSGKVGAKLDVKLLESLPGELREALANLNMQAEVVL